MTDELIALEMRSWHALSSSEEGAARRFFADLLHDDARMLFPGGLVLSGRQQILESLAAQPWEHFDIRDPHVLALGEHVGVVTYRVTARREGASPYAALVSSTYARAGDAWRLMVHQHTPE